MIYNVPSKWVCTIYPKGKRIDTESADNAKTANTETYRVLCKKGPYMQKPCGKKGQNW